ncbi:hypothetical protein CDAR_194451 [Caerostris darwini]|uniref:Uncharacterized protein n=1 Tax=Caerostris darwini TaxID=1538125 RepID=A0AAV4TL83_9ARAC|nr:hypothetical protein CDAR_194451 [Caerostris darwini]
MVESLLLMTKIIQPTNNLRKYQLTHLILLFHWLAEILEAFPKLMETLPDVKIATKKVDNLGLLIESISDIVHDPSCGSTIMLKGLKNAKLSCKI